MQYFILTRRSSLLALAAALCGQPVLAATIVDWNTSNVAVAPTPADGVTAASVIYNGDPSDTGAVATGAISFTPPEAGSPGLRVDNTPYEIGGPNPPSAVGCIMASSDSTCDGDFQSGKRFKEVITGFEPVDLVFNVDPTAMPSDGDTNVGYQVFQKLINDTGRSLEGITIELGFGVGDDFVASSAGDGLGFSTSFASGPDSAAAFSQFPFGLFGDAATNPNHELSGFFDPTATSGFSTSLDEDILQMSGLTGAYSDLFGPGMLSRDDVPTGAFWDDDGDPLTDAVLMAWYDEEAELWAVLRDILAGDPATIDMPEYFATLAEVVGFLGVSLDTGIIEDLANLNVNYAITLADTVSFENFTLRVSVAPVPLPLSAPLLLSGAGVLALMRRRQLRAA